MRVHIDGGGNITAVGDELAPPYVEFGINAPSDLSGYTVTGTAPNRLLVAGSTTVASEIYTPTAPAPIGGGSGTSTPPGQAAHYIGTWDVAVAYTAGECVRVWDAGNAGWQLCQAKKTTTGVTPTLGADNSDWAFLPQNGSPIMLWGTEDPNTTDSANLDGGGGVAAPGGSLYITVQGSAAAVVQSFSAFAGAFVLGQTFNGSWHTINAQSVLARGAGADAATTGDVYGFTHVARAGGGGGDATVEQVAAVSDSGDGSPQAYCAANRSGTGSGDAFSQSFARVQDAAVGTAYAGDTAIHHAGTEAHVRPTANDTGAFNDVKGDVVFTANTEGPVIHDQSDGHTYRIVCTAGVLSTVQVT